MSVCVWLRYHKFTVSRRSTLLVGFIFLDFELSMVVVNGHNGHNNDAHHTFDPRFYGVINVSRSTLVVIVLETPFRDIGQCA